MLTRVRVDNYHCLVNFELELGPLTLLVGANGSGKTSLLEALQAIRGLSLNERPLGECFPWHSQTRWDSREQQTIELDVDFDGSKLQYVVVIQHAAAARRRAPVVVEQTLTHSGVVIFRYKDGEQYLFDSAGKQLGKVAISHNPGIFEIVAAVPAGRWFLAYLRRAFFGQLHPLLMAEETREEAAWLDDDTSNFVAWYRHMTQDNPSAFVALMSDLREVIPGLDHLKLAASPAGRVLTCVFDGTNGSGRYELTFDELSDGQHALIALYALIHGTPEDTILFIDEPDNYVTSREIQPWLTRAFDLARQRRLQLVLASHHPEVINYAAAERAWLLERPGGGPAVARRLEVDLEAGQTADEALREALA